MSTVQNSGFGIAVFSVFLWLISASLQLAAEQPIREEVLAFDSLETDRPAVSAPESDANSSAWRPFEATAYCINGITFSGVRVARGIVAADPKILPIGSVIELRAGQYSGIYTVLDTGGVIKGSIIDIYMPSYEEAIQFGRQMIEIRVLRNGWEPTPP